MSFPNRTDSSTPRSRSHLPLSSTYLGVRLNLPDTEDRYDRYADRSRATSSNNLDVPEKTWPAEENNEKSCSAR